MKTPKIVFTLSAISLLMGLADEADAEWSVLRWDNPTHRPIEVSGPVFSSTASGSAAIYMTNTSGAGEDFVMVIPSHYRMHDCDDRRLVPLAFHGAAGRDRDQGPRPMALSPMTAP